MILYIKKEIYLFYLKSSMLKKITDYIDYIDFTDNTLHSDLTGIRYFKLGLRNEGKSMHH